MTEVLLFKLEILQKLLTTLHNPQQKQKWFFTEISIKQEKMKKLAHSLMKELLEK